MVYLRLDKQRIVPFIRPIPNIWSTHFPHLCCTQGVICRYNKTRILAVLTHEVKAVYEIRQQY